MTTLTISNIENDYAIEQGFSSWDILLKSHVHANKVEELEKHFRNVIEITQVKYRRYLVNSAKVEKQTWDNDSDEIIYESAHGFHDKVKKVNHQIDKKYLLQLTTIK